MGDGNEPGPGNVAASSDPAHSRQTAMSSAVLREVKNKLDSAVIRLEAVQQEQHQPAIARAVNLLLQAERELASIADGSAADVVDQEE